MKNFKTGALYLLFGSLLLGGSGSIALAQDDVLSAPTPTGSQLKGIQSRPVSPAQPAALAEPPDVVGQNGQAAPVATSLPTPSASTTPAPVSKASPVPTVSKPAKPLPTPTRTPTLRPEKTATPTPTPNRTTTPVVTPKLPRITTIPNPAYGDKVIFRVMAKVPSKAQVVVYDRFFTKVTQLSGEGDRLFDILWSLKKVQQGLYYYQTQITDSATGQTQMLPMQSFAVMKDDNPDEP